MNDRKPQQPKPVTGTLAHIYAARRIRVDYSSQRHHLLDLAARSNKLGQCYATIETLAEDQCVSPDTIHKNNRYWQERGVLTWVVGSSNQYKREANAYQLDLNRMERIVKTQPAKSHHKGSAKELLSRATGVQQTSAEPLLEVCSAAPEGLLRPAGAFAEPHQRVTKNTSKNTYIENKQEEETDFDFQSSPLSCDLKIPTEDNESEICFENLSEEQKEALRRKNRLEDIQNILNGFREVDDVVPPQLLLIYFDMLPKMKTRIDLWRSLNDEEKQSLAGSKWKVEMEAFAGL